MSSSALMADPPREMQRLQRFFDSVFGSELDVGAPCLPALSEAGEPLRPSALHRPPTDLCESADRYRVVCELPGVCRGDVALDVAGSVLTVAGRKGRGEQRKGDVWLRSERRCGDFARSFVLPEGTDPAGIRAELSDGVLVVDVPKGAGAATEARSIDVNRVLTSAEVIAALRQGTAAAPPQPLQHAPAPAPQAVAPLNPLVAAMMAGAGLFLELGRTALGGVFRSAAVEAAFRRHHAREFSSSAVVVSYCAVHLVALGVLGMGSEFSSVASGRRCPQRVFLLFVCACAALVVAALALLLSRRLRPLARLARAQAALCLALCALVAAAAPVAVEVCPRFAFGPAIADPPPALLSFGAAAVAALAYVLCGAAPWPRSAPAGLGGLALLEAAAALLLARSSGAYWYLCLVAALFALAVAVLGHVIAAERRGDFAAAAVLERERRCALQAKAAADELVGALFPGAVARAIIESQALARAAARAAAAPGAAAPAALAALSEPSAELASSSESSASASPFEMVARLSNPAIVISVEVGGLESVGDSEAQLQALSTVFIEADHIASKHCVDKVSSHGPSLLFAAGVTKENTCSAVNCCMFARDVARLMGHVRLQAKSGELCCRVGMAVGTVVSGVIGVDRPRFDLWGYPVGIAKMFSSKARPGETLVSPDIADYASNHGDFQFTRYSREFAVGLIATVRPYSLEFTRARVDRPFSSGYRRECVKFSAEEPCTLASVVAGDIPCGPIHALNPLLLSFDSLRDEWRYLAAEAPRSALQCRAIMAFFALANTVFVVVLYALRRGTTTAAEYAVHTARVLLLWLFVPAATLLAGQPRLYYAATVGLCAAATVLTAVYVVALDYADGYMLLVLAWVVAMHLSRLPWYLVAPLTALMCAASLAPVAAGRLPAISAILLWQFGCAMVLFNRVAESTARCHCVRADLALQAKAHALAERQVAELLVRSVVPPHILAALQEPGNECRYFAYAVPRATALVCRLYGIESLYRHQTDPCAVIRVLAAAFSRLDALCQSHGLSALKTIGDEYVVVANVAGVIKARSYFFDCWGTVIPEAERYSALAPINTALLSPETVDAVDWTSSLDGSAELLPFQVQLDAGPRDLYLLRSTCPGAPAAPRPPPPTRRPRAPASCSGSSSSSSSASSAS
eukprot:m51a1_g9934 hypothetical protein (1152) ;mRNA; r:61428-69106